MVGARSSSRASLPALLAAFMSFLVARGASLDCFAGDIENWTRDVCCESFEGGCPACFDRFFTYQSCCDEALFKHAFPPVKVALMKRSCYSTTTFPDDVGKIKERIFMFTIVVEELNLTGTWVEVGVQKAQFSTGLLKSLRERGNIEGVRDVYLVDTWKHHDRYDDKANVENDAQADNMEISIRNARPFWQSIHFLQIPSARAAPVFHDNSLDFVYLDARHDYCGVEEDILAWWPKLRPGGVLAGDDYGDPQAFQLCSNGSAIEGGVKRALEDVLEARLGISFHVSEFQWLAQK